MGGTFACVYNITDFRVGPALQFSNPAAPPCGNKHALLYGRTQTAV